MKIGVLMIGSLYWSCHSVREQWRKKRLIKDGQVRVKAQIRYGRRSRKRGNSYTMVFSEGLDPARYGDAIVLPFRNPITHSDHLIREARHLWAAERKCKRLEGISGDWGCIALFPNPRGGIPGEIVEDWANHVSGQEIYPELKFSDGEAAAVDASGILRIQWPRTLCDSEIEFDALLATATDPHIDKGRYATVQEIADAWTIGLGKEFVSYFENNRSNGIRTAQDQEIKDLMKLKCRRQGSHS